jgi:hypothetical protein
VDVIGHQYIGVQGAALACLSLSQPRQVETAIGIIEEDDGTVVSPLDDMVGLAGDEETGQARHERSEAGGGCVLPYRKQPGNNVGRWWVELTLTPFLPFLR